MSILYWKKETVEDLPVVTLTELICTTDNYEQRPLSIEKVTPMDYQTEEFFQGYFREVVVCMKSIYIIICGK